MLYRTLCDLGFVIALMVSTTGTRLHHERENQCRDVAMNIQFFGIAAQGW
jgi:hypothetical protein